MTTQEDDYIVVDGAVLRDVARQGARRWTARAAAAFLVMAALGLFVLPQSYVGQCSVAVQGTGGGAMSALGLLTGQDNSKRYIGILKSRWAAEHALQQVDVQHLYRLKTHADAVDLLMKSVKADDNATDGLLYIDVTLKGPPRLSFSSARRTRVKDAAAAVANAYADALHQYYLHNDIDHETTLVRDAHAELLRARSNYQEAERRLSLFALGLNSIDPRASPSIDTTTRSPSEEELVALYQAQAQTQAQISGDEAAQSTEKRMVAGQLSGIATVPAEDPLLASARQTVVQDQAQLDLLRIEFGPEYPSVHRAEARLQIDRDSLEQQISGVAQNRTTRMVRLSAELDALRAREATLDTQIAGAEQHLNISRRLSGDYLSLRTELEIALETLKATETEAAKIRLDNVSAQSRMSVVDAAIPPRVGSPNILIVLMVSLTLAILGWCTALARAYSRRVDAVRPIDAGAQSL
ncbi:MAG: hypothetical protein ACLQVD_17340 [Capsulimonadaceae bacterium]